MVFIAGVLDSSDLLVEPLDSVDGALVDVDEAVFWACVEELLPPVAIIAMAMRIIIPAIIAPMAPRITCHNFSVMVFAGFMLAVLPEGWASPDCACSEAGI